MACKNICKLCNKLILSASVTFAGGNVVVNIPAGSYQNGEKYCIVIAQPIPETATVNAPVVITIGEGTTTFPLTTKCCQQVIASAIRTRTKYSTVVITSSTGGVFRLLGDLCHASADGLPSIDGTT